MTQALYRKYRSKSFNQVVGQDHITKTLKEAIDSGRISHAYLFSGPRGTGKTSVARILAHEVNQLPYDHQSIHLDIIEIDGASNRRIDEIRDLRERVHIAPASAKYKVYIIDEVHMLTKEAFNALLKTLEEPPQHCIFILATTEAHKLPATIVSRTQRFNFKPIDAANIVQHLGNIAKKEKIDITPEALILLAEYGDGSFRDSISLLDQLSSMQRQITDRVVRDFLGLPAGSSIKQILNAVKAGDSRAIVKTLKHLSHQGSNPVTIAQSISKELRAQLTDNYDVGGWPALLRQLLDVGASSQPQDFLEICLLEAASQNNSATNNAPISQLALTKVEVTKKVAVQTPQKRERQSVGPASRQRARSSSTKALNLSQWPDILHQVKEQTPTLYSALRLAKPEISVDTLRLVFQFPLHQKKVNQAKYLHLIGGIVDEQTGAKLIIRSVVDKELFAQLDSPANENQLTPDKSTANLESAEHLETISNIFGAAEVLES